jgi:molybdopterin-containing oxidoreductase family iron-sulfur binding subunit
MKIDGFDPTRRSFLNAAAAAAGVALAPGVMLYAITKPSPAKARALDAAVSSAVRWGMLIDSNRCDSGCNECVTACNTENGLQGHGRPATDAQWIRKVDVHDPGTGLSKSLPVMCQHCAEPPCVDVCPTGASFKRADGIVLVDKHTCIGCRYCMMACPYKARSFVHEALEDQKTHAPRGKGTVESCTMCVHRIDDGRQPACVEACNDTGGGAMLFGDLNDPDSEISQRVAKYASQQIRADLGLDPGVRYQNL